jgi:hypothetical protein
MAVGDNIIRQRIDKSRNNGRKQFGVVESTLTIPKQSSSDKQETYSTLS